MPVSSADLWKLLRQSHLIAPERLEQIRSAVTQSGKDPDQVSAEFLVQWLLQRQLLTAYQANILLNGRAGPFCYGDYQIQQRVRGGRFAKTFQAVHNTSRYRVLLKFADSRLAQDPRQWNAARQYVGSIAPVVHEQLQRVFALENQSGYRFLVLELLGGMTVAEQLERERGLRVATACHWASQIARGLSALHQHDQVYGELCPDNLWLDASGAVKLVRDRFLPPVVPAPWLPDISEAQVQQANYLAPELANPGTVLNPATDLYALGCLLYQLLQGEVPFGGGDFADKLQRHARQAPRPLSAQAVDRRLVELLDWLMAKDAARRATDAAEIADQLAVFAEPAGRRTSKLTPSATLLAYEQALGQGPAVASPAPPPVLSEPDDHPPLPEPPVQRTTLPAHLTQNIEPALLAPSEPAASRGRKEIDVVARPRRSVARKAGRRTRNSRRNQALALSALAIVALACAGVVVTQVPSLRDRMWRTDSAASTAGTEPGASPVPQRSTDRDDGEQAAAISAGGLTDRFEMRQDDGKLLWMTPTSGAPIQLRHIAPGAQVLLIARPHSILASARGGDVLRALGPNLAAAIGTWESQAGVRLPDVAQLVCSLHTTASSPQVSLVIQLQQPRSRSDLLAAWAAVQTKQHAGMDYFVGPAWSYYIPDQEAVTTFVMSSESLIHELIDAGDAAPLVRREFAELLQEIDAQRQVTILVAPDAFDYELPRLRSPSVYWPRVRDSLQWLWTSDTTAGLLSFHLADTFYVELRACGPAGLESDSIAERLRDRLARIPDQIETLLAQQYPPPYWRRVALRYPEMTRYATRYVRVGVENDQAIANLVLPGQAAHNLVFGAEMLLGSPAGNESEAIVSSAPATRTPQTIEELLQQTRNLRFDQKSLEFAIQDFSVDIREDYPDLPFPFEIRILGADLQLGGITRNQQIANFTAEGQTIADILTRMLMRANPITTVTDPSEPDQKLVWVVAADPDDPVKRVVLITTRDAAQREGYKLPAPFQAK